jgi:hypothetical protein
MAKIPAKLYVTARLSGTVDPTTGLPTGDPAGFLNAYEPGKAAFEKKKATQDKWAYLDYSGLSWGARLEKQGNELVIIGEKAKYDRSLPYPHMIKIPVCKPVDWQPQIWDNVPTTGFKIVDTVSRYSTSNKFWLVLDPRGVKFEISTGMFETLIMNTTIIKGVIQEACVWETNKKLVVAP